MKIFKEFRKVLALVVLMFIIYVTHNTLCGSSPADVTEDDPESLFRYFHWSNSTSCKFSAEFGFSIDRSQGFSAPKGQKTVCMDPGVSPSFRNCLIYSFGIHNQWSFEEAMELFRCQIHAFDPWMGIKDHDRSDRIHFHNLGLSTEKEINHKKTNKRGLKTLKSIHKYLSPLHGGPTVPIDVLKLDISVGSEWLVIPLIIQSGILTTHVKQLVVEIHFQANDSLAMFQHYYHILNKLESNGFVRFSSRPNPWMKRWISELNREDYIAFEMSWYNNRFYESN